MSRSGGKLSRRLASAALASVVSWPALLNRSARGQAADEASLDETMIGIGRGLGTPTAEEVLRAQETLDGAPSGPCHPFRVAQWFLDLDADDITETPSGPAFRANPIIVEMFRQATSLHNPTGDETWWCAAFVNWCLMRASQERTRSAASASFRQWHTVPEPSKRGDIVVFRSVSDPAHGHVGFFVDFDVDNKVMTLGGNQRNGGRPMVCVHSYPRHSNSLILLSFHRDPSWPSLS